YIDYLLNDDTYRQFNYHVNSSFISFVCAQPIEHTRPIFSAFTPCFNTYEKIHRVYASILSQTMGDWEWIIMDDSPDDKHFQFLRDVLTDPRVRLYRRSKNSGCIGNVKNEAASLCRGKYSLELDHDDVILPTLFEEAFRVFEKDDSIGFVYSDFFNIYESGANFRYSDFISYGYGGYYTIKHEGVWRYVYITPNVNNITASALISLPNHPRIWRSSVLHRIGNYSEYLPICDDLDILIRTFADETIQVAKIHKPLYIQYMNEGGNNFSWIRNAEINRIGPQWISPILYKHLEVIPSFQRRDSYEDIEYLKNHSQIWKRPPNYRHKYINQIVQFDYTKQICIIGKQTFLQNIPRLQNLTKTDVILLDNQGQIEDLWNAIDQ
ncbi:glycosyltransferase, partial [bacterium]|nr:glycosyltransferase [bacterium]